MDDDALILAAYDLAEEMRDSPRWRDAMNRVGDTEGVAELRKRCPGYPEEAYGRALAKGFFASR
jgi:hypothetical protein